MDESKGKHGLALGIAKQLKYFYESGAAIPITKTTFIA